ncbi:MAG: hypothetical protein KJP04_08435 [Arenicella sp.]|nr:hypothetical protein [Arenicella sp.]
MSEHFIKRVIDRIISWIGKLLRWTGRQIRKIFSWKGFLKTVGALLVLIVVGAVGFLWYISNYPNIPPYTEITEYRLLNPSEEATCPNPNATGDDDKLIPSYQGWCNDMRQTYYRTPQGTDFFGLQYDWMTALEKPVGKDPLVTREYMQQLGYIYDPMKKPNENNPNDLPVGLTWHYDKDSGAKILDVSCSACHSAQLTYRGTSLVIDGGPGGHALPSLDLTQFLANSFASLGTTYINPFKFGRFARKVLKDVPQSEYRAKKRQLRKDTWNAMKAAAVYYWYNRNLYPTTEGYGRTDGLGRIANTVYGDYLSPKNYKIADAPVNYPHVWDIWAFDWVQWMGSVRQAMARNVNEAMGTRAKVNLVHATDLYDNSVMMPEVHCIETTLQHLKPPTWPTDLFGEIDQDLKAEGEKIFGEVCETCHGPFPRNAPGIGPDAGMIDYSQTGKNHNCTTCHGPFMTGDKGQLIDLLAKPRHPVPLGPTWGPEKPGWEDQTARGGYWEMIHIPLNYIGTDPTSALNMINNKFDLTPLIDLVKKNQEGGEGLNTVLRLPDPKAIPNPSKTGFAEGLQYIGGEVRWKQYREWNLSTGYEGQVTDENAVADLDGFGELDNPYPWRAYRPRPLEGVWATAPFLHNGSVPSIYQLLLPVEERDEVFYLGRKEYDPEHLGLVVKKFKGAFEFDTSQTGNSNLGHEFNDGLCGDGVIGYAIKDRPGYCRQFNERERMAILEYLKVHSDGQRPNPESEPHCINSSWPEKPESTKTATDTNQTEGNS